ncbi:MAG: electron transfer flavoprotein subunit beta/FixA family protein [Syntrophomonadaceae bacterium]|jgi:electron transfer flavoprotein beta subunit
MLDIICCFKWVVDEAYVKAGASGKLDLEWANYKLSDYDRNAIEAAVQIGEQHGGRVAAITVGTPDAGKGIKDALSRGPEQAYFINDPAFANLEPSQTAAILADVIKARMPFDIIVCGEGSSDLYAQQVGPRLAENLNVPCITYVQKADVQGDRIVAERKTAFGLEVLQAPLPVLITVAPDINTPRIPGLKDTLGASKKPVVNISKDDLPGDYPARLITKQMSLAKMDRNCVKFGADAAAVKAFSEALMKAGLLNRG